MCQHSVLIALYMLTHVINSLWYAFELWCWRRLLRVPWTARRSNQSILKEISPGISWKKWCWSWNSSTLASSWEEFTHWKRLWCWEGLGAGGEGDDRGWDGWMASPTRWTSVWVDSGSWWWTGRPGVLQFMGSQRVRHDWATELNWTHSSILAWRSPWTGAWLATVHGVTKSQTWLSNKQQQLNTPAFYLWWSLPLKENAGETMNKVTYKYKPS